MVGYTHSAEYSAPENKKKEKAIKKVALVDIDNCLLQNGALNIALVERLKSDGYDEIILFTQRSKFIQEGQLFYHVNDGHNGLVSTPDILQALSEQGLPDVKVSTSVDQYHGQPTEYYHRDSDGLGAFESRWLAALRKQEEHVDRSSFTLEKNKEIEGVRASLRLSLDAHPNSFYPRGKVDQYQHLLKEKLLRDIPEGQQLQVDYFDDSGSNIFEIMDDLAGENRSPADVKFTAHVVIGPCMAPIDNTLTARISKSDFDAKLKIYGAYIAKAQEYKNKQFKENPTLFLEKITREIGEESLVGFSVLAYCRGLINNGSVAFHVKKLQQCTNEKQKKSLIKNIAKEISANIKVNSDALGVFSYQASDEDEKTLQANVFEKLTPFAQTKVIEQFIEHFQENEDKLRFKALPLKIQKEIKQQVAINVNNININLVEILSKEERLKALQKKWQSSSAETVWLSPLDKDLFQVGMTGGDRFKANTVGAQRQYLLDKVEENLHGFNRDKDIYSTQKSEMLALQKMVNATTLNVKSLDAEQDAKQEMLKKAQACLQEKLIECALAKARQEGADLCFDLNGHLIVDVVLKENDYQSILGSLGVGIIEPDSYKKTLEDCLGIVAPQTLASMTHCNLDIAGLPDLEAKFKEWIVKANETVGLPEKLKDKGLTVAKILENCERLLNGVDEQTIDFVKFPAVRTAAERKDIIALQSDVEKQLSLMENVINKKFTPSSLADLPLNLAIARKELNIFIRAECQQALVNSYNYTDSVDFEKLQQEMLSRREKIFAESKRLLINVYKKSLPREDQATFETVIQELTERDFKNNETTDAQLITDADKHTCVYSSATSAAWRNKELYGTDHKDFGLRFKHTSAYRVENGKPTLTPLTQARTEACVPSIALTHKGRWATLKDSESSIPHKVAVNDVKEKITAISTEMRSQAKDYTGPISYCLLTSITSKPKNALVNTFFRDQQRKSASRILKGAHLYNKANPKEWCLVQNMGVDQKTLDLNYTSRNSWFMPAVLTEATLMAELSLLSLFNQQVLKAEDPTAAQVKIRLAHADIMKEYEEFLKKKNNGDKYFCQSKHGKSAIEKLIKFKEELKAELIASQPEAFVKATSNAADFEALALHALQSMVANNLHLKKENGALVQSLTVFLHRMPVYGCESGKALTETVAECRESLDGIREKLAAKSELSVNDQAFIKALHEYAKPNAKSQCTEKAGFFNQLWQKLLAKMPGQESDVAKKLQHVPPSALHEAVIASQSGIIPNVKDAMNGESLHRPQAVS